MQHEHLITSCYIKSHRRSEATLLRVAGGCVETTERDGDGNDWGRRSGVAAASEAANKSEEMIDHSGGLERCGQEC